MALNRSGVIQVSWSAPRVPSGELNITGYSIQYNNTNRSRVTFQYTSVPATFYETVITSLAPGTAYQVYVAGVNAIGRGLYCCEGSPVVVRTYNGMLT